MSNKINEIGIGIQDFSKLIENNNFYIDKRYSPNIQGKPEEIGRNDLSPDDNQE